MLTVEYACPDGTPFPVTFATAEDAALEWRLEQEHTMGPGTPLARALAGCGRAGGERASAEAGLPLPSQWRPGPEANGFAYHLDRLPAGAEMAKLFERCGRLVQEYGSALGIWRQHSLPRVEAACARLQSAPHGTPTAALAEEHDYALQHTMVSAMVTWNDLRLMTETCVDLYGDDAEFVASELAQGYENETLRANQRLWELAQGPNTEAALEEFLTAYGWRSETWSVDSPTWRQRGDGFSAQLRQLARARQSPEEVVHAAAARRDALVAEIDARLADTPESRARFHRRVERLASYVPVREERAHWQLVAVGSLRHAVLERGRALVDAGVIERADDVFFLTPDEFDDPPAVLAATVADRRAEHERWRRVRPPLEIGGETPEGGDASRVADDRTVRGVAASRGVAQGRARVIVDLADADRLEPGDVLVCAMTAPPWTPLFALASAVVTDSGGLGSHSAIAAREYGLPCVVGTGVATEVIPDGAHVIVDANAGTVVIQ